MPTFLADSVPFGWLIVTAILGLGLGTTLGIAGVVHFLERRHILPDRDEPINGPDV